MLFTLLPSLLFVLFPQVVLPLTPPPPPFEPNPWFNPKLPTPFLFYRHGEPYNAWDWWDSYHYSNHSNSHPELEVQELKFRSHGSELISLNLDNHNEVWRKERHRPLTLDKDDQRPTLAQFNDTKWSIFDFLQSRLPLRQRLSQNLQKAKTYFSDEGVKTDMDAVVFDVGSVETPQYQGTAYKTSGGKMEHDAEQLEYLVQQGKLPRDFLAVSRAYRQIMYDIFLKPLSDGAPLFLEGCCFSPSLAQFEAMHFLHNTLIYYPPTVPVHLTQSALHPGVDWNDVETKYNAGHVVKIDQVLNDWALEAAYTFCLEATIYWEQNPGYLGAYMASGLRPPGGIMDQITNELRLAMPNIVGNERLSNFWTYKYSNTLRKENVQTQKRKLGLGKHADPASLNLNMWLTPDEACLDPVSGGMTIFDMGVETKEMYHQSQVRENDFLFDRMMEKEKTRSVNIKYKRNRMVLFDSRLIHASGVNKNSQDLQFKKGYTNRRISLTWLFGAFKDHVTGERVNFGPRL